jgi:hypothetical protein
MLIKLEETQPGLMAIQIKGKVEAKDFELLEPLLEKAMTESDTPKAYVELVDFDSLSAGAVWADIKNIPDYNKFEKVAIVGDAKWKEFMANASKLIMKPTLKYFDIEEKASALEWVRS